MSPKFWRMRCHIWPEQKIMLIPCFVMFVHPKTWKYGHYSKNQRFFGIIIGIWKSQNHPKWPKSRNFQVLGCKNITKHGINMIFCSGKMWHIIFQNFGDLCKGGGCQGRGCGLKRENSVVNAKKTDFERILIGSEVMKTPQAPPDVSGWPPPPWHPPFRNF